MDAQEIEHVLQSLQEYPWGWRVPLPGVNFLGKPVELKIDTRICPQDDPPPRPNSAEVALVQLILASLSQLLPNLEEQYRHHVKSPDIAARVHEPNVWVSRETMTLDGKSRWTFVIGIAQAPDWGTHAEFDGLSFHGMWSGD